MAVFDGRFPILLVYGARTLMIENETNYCNIIDLEMRSSASTARGLPRQGRGFAVSASLIGRLLLLVLFAT
jgi:hypothetical protein